MEFKIISEYPDRDFAISTIERIHTSPSRVVEVLGSQYMDGSEKVSRQWLFLNEHGHVFGVCDWKATSLYEDYMPTPDEFWQSVGITILLIRGEIGISHDELMAFSRWIRSQVFKESQSGAEFLD